MELEKTEKELNYLRKKKKDLEDRISRISLSLVVKNAPSERIIQQIQEEIETINSIYKIIEKESCTKQ